MPHEQADRHNYQRMRRFLGTCTEAESLPRRSNLPPSLAKFRSNGFASSDYQRIGKSYGDGQHCADGEMIGQRLLGSNDHDALTATAIISVTASAAPRCD